MLHRPLVGVIDLRRIMSAAMQPQQLLVAVILHQLQQLGILPKEVAPKKRAILCLEGLEVAIDTLFHAS